MDDYINEGIWQLSDTNFYTEANHELLELANVVLAVTNLNQTGMTGGSAEVLATAKSREIDVIVLNTLETEDAPLSPNLLRAEP